MRQASNRGFTLVEVLVALMVVALGLAALMTAVSGTARTSGYLRDKTLAQWIALNRIAQVRLMTNRLGDTKDTGQLVFANRTWHYDTRYFDTTFPSTKRIVVRVWAGDAKTKGNPVATATGFLGADLTVPGGSNQDWTQGTTATPNTTTPCTPSVTTGPNANPCPPGTQGASATQGNQGAGGASTTPINPPGAGRLPGAPP